MKNSLKNSLTDWKRSEILGFFRHFTPEKTPRTKAPSPRARSFTGARGSRLESDWVTSSTSADAELVSALRQLRNRSREQLRNNDYARGAVATLVNNVIGTGISFQAQVKPGRGFADNRNTAIEDLFCVWSKPKNCDMAERLSFHHFQRLAFRSLIESGEVFIRKHYDGKFIPFRLELIESDRVEEGFGYSPQSSPSGNLIKMGIELNQYGKPLYYYLRPTHPGDIQFHPKVATQNGGPYSLERVPADQMIHLYIPDRPGQSRGVPWFASSLQRIKNLEGYFEAELVAARASAAVMGFRITKDPDLMERDESGQPVDSLEPGTIKELAPGEEFVGFDPTRPNQAFEPFVRQMLRSVAANLGIDFESLSRDFSQSNYSSSRLALLQVRDTYRQLQCWFIESFLQPVLEEWMDAAVLSGKLKFPDFELKPERYTNVRWRPRGWGWVDPWKETQASVEAINNGLSTLTAELAKQGLDIEEVLLERATELDLAEELGVPLGVPPGAPSEMEDEEPIASSTDSRAFTKWLSQLHLYEEDDDE